MTLFEENNESLFEESSNNEINLLQKELSVSSSSETSNLSMYSFVV